MIDFKTVAYSDVSYMISLVNPDFNVPEDWQDNMKVDFETMTIRFKNLQINGSLNYLPSTWKIVFRYVKFLSGVDLSINTVQHSDPRYFLSLYNCYFDTAKFVSTYHYINIFISNCYGFKTLTIEAGRPDLKIDQAARRKVVTKSISILITSSNGVPSSHPYEDIHPRLSFNMLNAKSIIVKGESNPSTSPALTMRGTNVDKVAITTATSIFNISKSTLGELNLVSSISSVFISNADISAFRGSSLITSQLEIRSTNIAQLTMTARCKIDSFLLTNSSRIGNILLGASNIVNFSIVERVDVDRFIFPIKLCKIDNLVVRGIGELRPMINKLSILDGHLSAGSKEAKSSITFENFNLSDLEFCGVRNEANLFINKVNHSSAVKNFDSPSIPGHYVSELKKVGISIGTSYRISNQLSIIESDLGKVNFVSCDFADMTLDFQSSKIIEIFLSGTKMPREITSTSISDQQIGYGQLKKVFENRGDTVESTFYLSKELDAFYNSLKKENLQDKKRSWPQWWDFATLCLNKESNNFGTEWYRSAGHVVWIMAVLYLFHNWALGYRIGSPFVEQEMNYFYELLSLYPEFIFPIHKADYIADSVSMSVTNWSRFWDVIGRVVSGYLIYQMIQAFRKFGKK